MINAGSHVYTCCSTPVQYALVDGLAHKQELEAYIRSSRAIMSSAGRYVHKQLTGAGVAAVCPEAGFYLMPDFEKLRAGLLQAGIQNGQEMCDAMLREANVAVRNRSAVEIRACPNTGSQSAPTNCNGSFQKFVYFF